MKSHDTLYVDLLNGILLEGLQGASWSSDENFVVRSYARDDDAGSVSLLDCRFRSEKESCQQVWSDAGLFGPLRKVSWKAMSVEFLAGDQSGGTDAAPPGKLYQVQCQLQDKASCKKTFFLDIPAGATPEDIETLIAWKVKR